MALDSIILQKSWTSRPQQSKVHIKKGPRREGIRLSQDRFLAVLGLRLFILLPRCGATNAGSQNDWKSSVDCPWQGNLALVQVKIELWWPGERVKLVSIVLRVD